MPLAPDDASSGKVSKAAKGKSSTAADVKLNQQKNSSIDSNSCKDVAVKPVIRKTLYDILSAIQYMDELDAGFTIMIRIPGTLPQSGDIKASNLSIGCYLPTGRYEILKVEQPIAKLVQMFAEEIACSHLRNVQSFHLKLGTNPPTHATSVNVLQKDFPLIPHADNIHPCYFKFSGLPPGVIHKCIAEMDEEMFEKEAVAINWDTVASIADKLTPAATNISSASGQGSGKASVSIDANIADERTPSATDKGSSPIQKLGNASVSVSTDATNETKPNIKLDQDTISETTPAIANIKESTKEPEEKEPLISIGPHSDVALDLLHLSDRILPNLRRMTVSFRSSRWIQILEGPEYDLSHEAAVLLAAALLKDTKLKNVPSKKRGRACYTCVLSAILRKILAKTF